MLELSEDRIGNIAVGKRQYYGCGAGTKPRPYFDKVLLWPFVGIRLYYLLKLEYLFKGILI